MSLKDIRLVRDATVIVKGVAHELHAGWQKVEQEVADHWMVKALTDNNDDSNNVDTRDAQILELSGQLGQMKEDLAAATASAANAAATEQKVADLTMQLASVKQDRDNALADLTAANSKVASMQTSIDAANAANVAQAGADSSAKAKAKNN